MSIIKELTLYLQSKIKECGYDIDNLNLQVSSRPDLGDYQLNDAMNLAKKYGKNPRQIAEDILRCLEGDYRFINLNIAGPGFINLTLSEAYLVDVLNKISQNLEVNIDKVEKHKIILDYGGANVAKALHVGHLRSANIGEALKRLAILLGNEVLGDAHLGDYGRPLGLIILEIKKKYPDLAYFDEDYKGDYDNLEIPITNKDLEELYPIASKKSKEDEDYLEEAREITFKIQNHQRGYYDLWKKIVDISKTEIKGLYDRLNVNFELWQGESDAMEYFEELKQMFEKKGILEDSDGAKIVEIKTEEDKAPMPPLLFIKSNGSISYETTDLAAILERKKKFNPDEIWYCVDNRQSLHFEQVFRAARKADLVSDRVKLDFIGFGTMNGKDGKPFKTRDGSVMALKDLIEIVKSETLKRINPETVPEKDRDSVSEAVAIAALKYADFLPFRTTDYIFDVEKFSDLEGKTGPYLLYSTIRMKSLLSKAAHLRQNRSHEISGQDEKNIILTILNLPNILTKSYETRTLNEIAEYLYRLTSQYNKFYAEHKILTEKKESRQESWLVLTKVVYDINIMLLSILGIKVPEKI